MQCKVSTQMESAVFSFLFFYLIYRLSLSLNFLLIAVCYEDFAKLLLQYSRVEYRHIMIHNGKSQQMTIGTLAVAR